MPEEKKNSNFKETSQIIKSLFKSSYKAHKPLWIFSTVVLALVLVIGIAAVIFTTNNRVSTYVIASFLPKSVHMENLDEYNMDFYRETNKEYYKASKLERKNMTPFNVYYIDESGEKVYLEEGYYYYTDSSGTEKQLAAYYDFFIEASGKFAVMKSNVKLAAWILAGLVVVAAIFVWYRFDRKQYLENRPKFNRKKQKKNKKS